MLKSKKEIYFRFCPECNKYMELKTKKYRNRAEKLKKLCSSCSIKRAYKTPETMAKVKILSEKRSITSRGKNNPFYGKHHTEETKEKIRNIDRSYTQTKKFRKNSARKGKQNGMYGKSVYDVWIKKYGKKEADKKMSKFRKKQSFNSSGSKNPMYGKPSPKGSGGGWGGWYDGWYFRSLRELSYVVRVIEKRIHKWESCETTNLTIPYKDYDGKCRNYTPDFILDKKIIIEVKPKFFMDIPSNVLKKEAAIKFCKNNNMEYRMIDVKILDTKQIIDMYLCGKIRFNKKYVDRIEKIIDKKRRNGEIK